LIAESIRSSSKDRYAKAIASFRSKFSVLNRMNIYNFLASLKSVSSMEVFLSAVVRLTGVSLFSDVLVRRIIDGKAQSTVPSVFPRPVNVFELWGYIRFGSSFSDVEIFALQIMLLLCARPSDISSLTVSQIVVSSSHISVARLGTKADRRFKGTPILIPITNSVFIPASFSGLSSALADIASLMSRALKACFPGHSLSPGIIRKSCACMLRQRNLSNRDIMEVGGWASEDTLRRFYSRANTNWITSVTLSDLTPFSSLQWPEMILAP
jgi:hypothetical protein